MVAQLAIDVTLLLVCTHAMPTTNEAPISLLLWSTSPWLNWGQRKFINTTLGACEILHDRTDIAKAEVVFFLWQWFNETEIPPLPRPHGAMWVYVSHESPADDKRSNSEVVKKMNGMINVLMTYDTAANVSFKYGKTVKRDKMLDVLPAEITMVRPGNTINGKTAYAVMVEGNCQSEERNNKIAELRKHINIDIIGRCGSVKHKECDSRDPACFDILAKTYYFYIAIENSECPDYITEKVWRNSLEAGMVPIVWSAKVKYGQLLPHRSFINVAEFESVSAVAERLKQIIKHPEANFERLQKWRLSQQVIRHFDDPGELCRFAHQHRGQELAPIDISSIRNCFSHPSGVSHAANITTLHGA